MPDRLAPSVNITPVAFVDEGGQSCGVKQVDGRPAVVNYIWNVSDLGWEAMAQSTVVVGELNVSGVAISNFPSSFPVTGSFYPTIYSYIQSEEDATYKYYGFASSSGWQIKRKTLASGVWMVAVGTGDYAAAWADKANKSYGYV